MAENRISRDMEARDTAQRTKTWTPPQILPEPIPVAGYKFRWVRTSVMGQFDPTNTSSKFREGWEPCKVEDHPEMKLYPDLNSRFKGLVEVGGLLLCKIPEEILESRAEYYANLSKIQMEAVDSNYMKASDPRMPLFSEKKSTVSFGRGAK